MGNAGSASDELRRWKDKYFELQESLEEQEKDRLLYVALTRAERWLVVAAAGKADTSAESWHDRVKATLETVGGVPHAFGFADDEPNEGLRLDHMTWPDPVTDDTVQEIAPEPSLPAIFETQAPSPSEAPEALSPSDLGGAKALPGELGEDSESAKS